MIDLCNTLGPTFFEGVRETDAILVTDLHFELKSWNDVAAALFELPDHHARQKSLKRLLRVELINTTWERAKNCLSQFGFWEGKLLFSTASGNKVICRTRARFLTGEDNRRIGVLVTCKCMTMLNQAEELRKERKKLEVLNEKITRQKEDQQKQINRAIFKAQEGEKSRIGRELHDHVNQLLATVNLYLVNLVREKKFNQPALEQCLQYINEAIAEIRNMTRRIASPVSASIGLRQSLEQLVQSVREAGNLVIILLADQLDEGKLGHDCKQNLFRIVQEQLNNIVKHAEARSVVVRITADTTVNLMITDDGKGFDVTATRKGVGLVNILHRAESFNGNAEIVSSAGNGCTLYVNIPIDNCL
jgi:two-component system sensor histidine kinase UhpB